MHCLYCKKRLWLFFSKEEPFCSKVHEAAYYDELSAMRRLIEFKDPVEAPVIPAPRNRTLTEIYRESTTRTIPPLCDFVSERACPKPFAAGLNTADLVTAQPFASAIQFPQSVKSVIAFTPASATEPAEEIVEIARETIGSCRVRSRRSRGIAPRTPAAFSSRTHRRRLG
jgi:hypothetical protein